MKVTKYDLLLHFFFFFGNWNTTEHPPIIVTSRKIWLSWWLYMVRQVLISGWNPLRMVKGLFSMFTTFSPGTLDRGPSCSRTTKCSVDLKVVLRLLSGVGGYLCQPSNQFMNVVFPAPENQRTDVTLTFGRRKKKVDFLNSAGWTPNKQPFRIQLIVGSLWTECRKCCFTIIFVQLSKFSNVPWVVYLSQQDSFRNVLKKKFCRAIVSKLLHIVHQVHFLWTFLSFFKSNSSKTRTLKKEGCDIPK